jgi:hypothetical protein
MSSVTLPKVAQTPKRGRRLQHRLLQRESTLGYALLVPTMLMLVVFLFAPVDMVFALKLVMVAMWWHLNPPGGRGR